MRPCAAMPMAAMWPAGRPLHATRRRVKSAHATMCVAFPRSHAVSLQIRSASLTDLPDLAAWNAAMAWETERKQLDPATLESGVRGVLEQPKRGFYLVAERTGVAIGSLLVT